MSRPDELPRYQRLIRRYPRFAESLLVHGWKCFWCEIPLDLNTITVDHYRAKSRGGKDTANNLVPACQSCNCSKGPKPPGEFRKYRERFRPQKVEIFLTGSATRSTYELEFDAVERKLDRPVQSSEIPPSQSFEAETLANMMPGMRSRFLDIAGQKAIQSALPLTSEKKRNQAIAELNEYIAAHRRPQDERERRKLLGLPEKSA
jgi:hypothetical protein